MEKWNSLHCLPVFPPQQSESHLSKLEEEIQQLSAALVTTDDLLSWYQCPHTPKHNWHMGDLMGLQLCGFANTFLFLFMIHVWSSNYVKISHYTEHISGQINLISSKHLLWSARPRRGQKHGSIYHKWSRQRDLTINWIKFELVMGEQKGEVRRESERKNPPTLPQM